jgi:GNAT superfamily N-acetyltransferase
VSLLPDPRTERDALLALFDRTERAEVEPSRPGERVERVGGVVRQVFETESGFVEAIDLTEDDVAAAVGEQVAFFTGLGEHGAEFEWKVYGHDRPASLETHLRAAGFVPQDEEAFVVGRTDDVLAATADLSAVDASRADGVRLREVTSATVEADAVAITAMHDAVWGQPSPGLAQRLVAEQQHDPWALRIHLAEVEGEHGPQVVSAAWLRMRRLPDGTPGPFAGLWGGSTLPGHRGRGIYRALVRARVLQAAAQGVPYVQVDASPDSRPILTRLGLVVLDWTRPFTWTPSAAATDGGTHAPTRNDSVTEGVGTGPPDRCSEQVSAPAVTCGKTRL